MSEPKRDTIYVDSEDEITAIIEKVRASSAKIVALVLPKRIATLQSSVNLKLLKHKATQSKKSLVLITSDANLLPLAGVAGLHVAKSLQSAPVIPAVATIASEVPLEAITSDSDEIDPQTSVGQLAGHVATEETIELDNDSTEAVVAKTKSNKKLKVPDFDRFRLLIFGGLALVILLIVGGVFAFVILPKAKIVIKTDSSSINTDLIVSAKSDAKTVDLANLIVPAQSKQVKKSDSEKVPATGQQNQGTKATGTLTLTNCINDGQPHTVPAGTGFSSGQFTFLTTTDITLATSVYSGSTCRTDLASSLGFRKDASVVAAQAGDSYNLGARSYNSPASMTTSQGSITATGSNMSGGTSKIVQVVSQTDVDNAKQKVIDKLTASSTTDLKNQFTTASFVVLTDTFTAGPPTIVSTPNVNEPSSDVNVTVTVTFTQLGVKQDDAKQIVEANIKKHIDSTKQVIQDNGISKAFIVVTDGKNPADVKFNIKTTATAGPQLDGEAIKKAIAGKKKNEAQNVILARPGIKDVTITYSPFWVYSTPKNNKHITVIFDQNNAQQ